MSTRYYLHLPTETLFIGKSSAGWCFSLHGIPERGLNDLDDWWRLMRTAGEIRDEYGLALTVQELMRVITERAWPYGPDHDAVYYARNSAVPGPNRLMRHALSSQCVKHGAGTWDVLVGEWS